MVMRPRIKSIEFDGLGAYITLDNGRTGAVTGKFAYDIYSVVSSMFNSLHDNTQVESVTTLPDPVDCSCCGVRHRPGYDNTMCPESLDNPKPLTREEIVTFVHTERNVVQPSLFNLRVQATLSVLLNKGSL